MLVRRLRRRPIIKTIPAQRLVCAGVGLRGKKCVPIDYIAVYNLYRCFVLESRFCVVIKSPHQTR